MPNLLLTSISVYDSIFIAKSRVSPLPHTTFITQISHPIATRIENWDTVLTRRPGRDDSHHYSTLLNYAIP